MVYINVVLTVREEENVEQVKALLAEQGRRSREEPGCLRFEVYHSTNNACVFILNEHWESQAALDIHRQAAACTEIYLPKVLPLVDRTPHVSELVE